MNIFKTIRFRLTLWYSLLVFLLGLILVIIINILITQYFRKDPANSIIDAPILVPRPHAWTLLDEEQREIIREYRVQDLDRIRELSALSLIPIVLISFAGGYLIAGQMLKPIKNVNKAIKEITIKNLQRQIDFDGPHDEIGELIDSFNKMTLRLNSSVELQKQFIANASHELKTPLAILQTNLETIEHAKSSSKKLHSQFIQNALNSVDFMNDLIEDLLLLSLLENHVEMGKVHVYEIIQNSIEALSHLSEEKGIKIRQKIQDKAFESTLISGNEVLLQRAFMNIIENSIKYSKKNSSITIEGDVSKNSVIIRVKDKGIGITRGDQKRIFERFYRVDKSRSRKSGGSGLGLAIVKRIITLHKGTIEVASQREKGSMFTISLPTS